LTVEVYGAAKMDVTTLRLASIQLTAPLLQQFLTYQRSLVTALDKTGKETDWSGRFAFAHSHALTESKLDSVVYGKLKALVSDWCARQTSLRQIKARLATAQASAAPSAKELSIIERAKRELPALEATGDFTERYGAEAVAILTGHDEEVLRLHREVAQREGCTRA
jgi:hypothetical protein